VEEASAGPDTTLLDVALESALNHLPPTGPLAVLFSGGVDSGLLAWELRGRPGVVLTTFGLERSADVVAARSAARLVGLPWAPTTAPPEEVERMSSRVEEWVGPLTATERSFETAFALGVQGAPYAEVVCGQGADELFFGYAHFRSLDPDRAAQRAEADLAALTERGWPREREIARRLGRSVSAPFLDPDFVRAARSIPARERLAGDAPKSFFRTWARRRGLPSEIAARPKKALQFGSGVDQLLRQRVRRP
jgi:asparagine synthase (glutamine-hydrolysing)